MDIETNKKDESRKDSRSGRFAGYLRTLLGGDFLTRKTAQKQAPFLFFLVFLAVIYIANSYYAEKKIRKIEDLQKEIKELRYEYVSLKSRLMQNSSQSAVARGLQEEGIVESTEPPKKIFVNETGK